MIRLFLAIIALILVCWLVHCTAQMTMAQYLGHDAYVPAINEHGTVVAVHLSRGPTILDIKLKNGNILTVPANSVTISE